MNYIFFIIIIFTLIDIETKLAKMSSQEKTKSPKKLSLKEYRDKMVYLTIDNDKLPDRHLFTQGTQIAGEIVDWDNDWLVFEYTVNKKIIKRYFRISEIKEIDEVEIS